MRSSRAVEMAAIALALLAGALAFTWPLAADAGGSLPAPGDSLYNAWVLGWVADRTAHGLSGVWDTPIFYPYRSTLALAEPLLGIAVPLAPAYWLTSNAVLFHNVAVWTSFVIAGTGGYALGRDLTGHRAAGLVCGAIAAFLPYRVAHLAHVQVLMAGWLWWTMWSVHHYFARPSALRALAAAACFIALGQSSLYWAYAGLVPIAIVAAAEGWRRRGPVRAWLLHAAGAALLCAVAYVPVALQLRSLTAAESPVASTVDRRSYSADLLDYVSVQPGWLVWGGLLRRAEGESALFPGVTAIACALAGIGAAFVRRRQASAAGADWTWIYAGIAAAGIVLSLGPVPTAGGRVLADNPLFDLLGTYVPGFAQLRASARFAVLAQLGLSVLAAIGVASWIARRRATRRTAWLTASVLTAAVLVEGLALPVAVFAFSPYQASGDRSTTHWLARRPGGAVVELPLDGWGPSDFSMVYQHRALAHGHRIVSGVSRYAPPLPAMLADPDSPLVQPERIAEGVAFLRALGVRFVVVHPELYANRPLGYTMRDALERVVQQPSIRFGQTAIVDLGEPPSLPDPAAADEVPVADLRISAPSGDVARMTDGDPATRWISGHPQRPDDRIDIALPAGTIVAGVRLQLTGRSLNDYPRGLEVSVSGDGERYLRAFSGSVFPALGAGLRLNAGAPVMEIRWPPVRARWLRLQPAAASDRWFWSVHELRLIAGG